MATITFQGEPLQTTGTLPAVGSQAPDFKLTKNDLSTATLADFKGKRVVMNIFPSIDTGVCATSVRNFNERAAGLKNTAVVCVSRDTVFAQNRFIGDEDLKNVTNLSDLKDGSFGKDYGLTIAEGPFESLHSRAVVVLDESGKVIYNEQVPEIAQEPNYLAALKTLL